MKILNIVLLGASLLASGAVAAKQAIHLPPNANQYYGFYQGPSDGFTTSMLGNADKDYRYPNDGLHPSPRDRASSWR